MKKIDKYSENNTCVHSLHRKKRLSCKDTQEHHHGGLYGQSKEVPAVFSYSTSFNLEREITGYELQDLLVECMEDLKQWVVQNKYFIGHIKVFVESEKSFNIWLSTTGKEINIKESEDAQNSNIKNITINITAIIFGPDEQALRSITLENLARRLPFHSE